MPLKIDGAFAWHPKVLIAGNEAVGAWTRAAAWSAEHGTDGWIPLDVALSIAPVEVWQRLADARPRGHEYGLVEPHNSGVQIHDFLKSNPTAERAASTKKARQQAGRKGGVQSAIRRGGIPFEARDSAIAEADAQANPEQRLEQTFKQELFVREEKDKQNVDLSSQWAARAEAKAQAHAGTGELPNGPATARETEHTEEPTPLVRSLLSELQVHGKVTADISTIAFATQLARHASGNPDGWLSEAELIDRVKRAADGVAGAANTGRPMRSPSGYVLVCVRQGPTTARPGEAPTNIPEDAEGVTRFLEFFDRQWNRARQRVRERAAADSGYAAKAWAAVKLNKLTTESAAPEGAWTPSEEDIVRSWITEFFRRETKILEQENWSLAQFVRGLGTYGMPAEPRKAASSRLSEDTGAGPVRRLSIGEAPTTLFKVPNL